MGADYLNVSRQYKGYHYTSLAPEKLEYLHKRSLEMFIEAKEIFDANNIKYIICGGTLLGAYCYGKFIPWDDDVDVCIFEEDYDKARECLIDGLSNRTKLQCTKTDSRYYIGWMKLRDANSHVYPDTPFKENGVWVDVYKLISTTKIDAPVLRAKENLDYLERRFAAGGLTREEYFNRLEQRKLHEALADAVETATLQKHNGEEDYDMYTIRTAAAISVKKEWVFPLKHVVFEGVDVTTFHDPEKYLIQHYGPNFGQFPADELRNVSIKDIQIN